jgi:hypothetical protein
MNCGNEGITTENVVEVVAMALESQFSRTWSNGSGNESATPAAIKPSYMSCSRIERMRRSVDPVMLANSWVHFTPASSNLEVVANRVEEVFKLRAHAA